MKDFKRLLPHLGTYRRDFIIGALLVVAETGFELIIPVLMADLIDVGVQARDLNYIVQKGMQMGLCALLALITGIDVRPLCHPQRLRLGCQHSLGPV